MATSCTPGAPGAISRAACGACTGSAAIRKATSTWPKSTAGERRSTGRGVARTRQCWSASPSPRSGTKKEAVVRKGVPVLVVVFLAVLSLAAEPQQQAGKDLSWAFPVINGALPAEDPTPKSLAGTT